jgi:hypothetical protein
LQRLLISRKKPVLKNRVPQISRRHRAAGIRIAISVEAADAAIDTRCCDRTQIQLPNLRKLGGSGQRVNERRRQDPAFPHALLIGGSIAANIIPCN